MENAAEEKTSIPHRAWEFAKRNKGKIAFAAASAVAVGLGVRNLELSKELTKAHGVIGSLREERAELYSIAYEMIDHISFLEDICAAKDEFVKALASEDLRLGGSLGGQCLAELRYAKQQGFVC